MSPHHETGDGWGAESQATSVFRGRPEDAVTMAYDLRSGEDIVRDPCDPWQTVVLGSKPTPKQAWSRLTGPRMPALGLALGLVLVALGFFGARAISRASRGRAPATHAAAPKVEARAQGPVEAAVGAHESAPVREATPAEAARSFALGEHERALAQYRHLAQAHPEVRAYAAIVRVLLSAQREH